jgi:hypothetical protein
MMDRMAAERRAQAALATMLIVIYGGAAFIALTTPLLPGHHGLAVALFTALPIAAIKYASQILDADGD